MKSQMAGVMEREEEPEVVRCVSSEGICNHLSQVNQAIARRAFDIFESRGRSPGHELEDWFRAESELLHPVALEATESEGKFVVRAEVPGFGGGEIAVIVEPLQLAIAGQRESEENENKKMVCSESRAGRIFRVFDFPSVVDTSNVSTTLKDGILIVELPKAQPTGDARVEPVAA